jgi:hypothetical protein
MPFSCMIACGYSLKDLFQRIDFLDKIFLHLSLKFSKFELTNFLFHFLINVTLELFLQFAT